MSVLVVSALDIGKLIEKVPIHDNENRAHRGNPLDVVTICPANGKYFNDCSLEELAIMANSFDKKCIGFLKDAGIL